ncbi:dodecin family protein [Ottowia sp.]|jgi:flavin-binding protein dodecin|uniref:dodecin family protein n=1 Tax=Ottowia sp. TaxID=1898956 RepID=UPI0025D55A55|nr:dodecin family protein [Ottowia sp.]MBK6612907.1 dodecin domain-containing protein [Ottowia sp.]MBK6747962.1 dodecin domain-containing protein [Ottowia sp.]
MSVAKVIEISASSTESFEDAILAGVGRATDTIDNVRGAWIKEQKVVIEGGRIKVYRVNMSVTFVVGEVDE